MKNEHKRNIGLNLLIGISIILLILLLVGQTYSLVNYDLTVSLGLQESEEEVTKIGIAWIKAFALGDTLAYIPLLIAGIIGLLKRKRWGFYSMFGSFAISFYWPVVNLSVIYFGIDDFVLSPDKYISYSILLPLISIYGLWGMWYLYKNQEILENGKQ